MAGPIRRSGRQRIANKKYANADWDKSTLKLLRESSESSGSTAPNSEIEELAEPDEEYDFKAVPVEEAPSDHSPGHENDGASSHVLTPDESDDGRKSKAVPTAFRKADTSIPLPFGNEDTSGTHSRGLNTDFREMRMGLRYQTIFGPEYDDLAPTLRARDQWMRGRDITVPSRESLDAAVEEARKLQMVDDVANAADDTRPMEPLSPVSQQKLRNVADEGTKNRFLPLPQKHSVVMGAWNYQKPYELEPRSTFQMGKAWVKRSKQSSAVDASQHVTTPASNHDDSPSPADETSPEHINTPHQGWLLNLGCKVLSLSWAPTDGNDQYLAISCRATEEQRTPARNAKLRTAPAFTPLPTYPSSIQIWAVHGLDFDGAATRRLDSSLGPHLVRVLCTEYGEIRELQWTPAKAKNAMADGETQWEPHIGSLVLVSSDGCVRLIDVPKQLGPLSCVYSLVEKPAFTARPPKDVVYTTCAFCSPTDLIVGASDGSASIYDIREGDGAQPYLTVQLHSTYIMSIRSAYPDKISYLIASSSASGDLLLTDLRSPQQDRVNVHRTRLPTKALHYSPQTRSFITTIDSAGSSEAKTPAQTSIVAHNVRHFYHTSTLGRLSEGSGSSTAIAGSPHHPCLLVGNAAGTVYVTNTVRKMILTGRPILKSYSYAYLQKLCEYDWRPLEKNNEVPIDLFHGQDARLGISRFHEGFRPERVDLISGGASRRKGEKKGDDVAAMATFEEEQAVTAMAWNSSARCSSWAAMGWGSGILRIQDLAIDII